MREGEADRWTPEGYPTALVGLRSIAGSRRCSPMAIDFAALAARLLQQSRSLLAEWYPQGKLVGHEYKIGDVFGGEGDSLSINVNSGQWSDFATGEKGGDLISLYAAREGSRRRRRAQARRRQHDRDAHQHDAASAADRARGMDRDHARARRRGADAMSIGARDRRTRRANRSGSSCVTSRDGRTSTANGHLSATPCASSGTRARSSSKTSSRRPTARTRRARSAGAGSRFPAASAVWSRPATRPPDAPVMVVEGEKKVDALKSIAPQYVGVAWPGGAAAWRKTDWLAAQGARRHVLAGRRQAGQARPPGAEFKREIGDLIPADHQPGMRAMWEIGHQLLKLCPTVKVIIPDDRRCPMDGTAPTPCVTDGIGSA
jgi:putative DNA primase/helicase